MPSNVTTEIVDVPSQFGATVADAERLLRKAKFCALFVPVGQLAGASPGVHDVALFEISKTTARENFRHMPANSLLPCELDLNDHRGPKLIFGGREAIEKAAQAGKFHGAQCPSYPNCTGGCGLGCTHEVDKSARRPA